MLIQCTAQIYVILVFVTPKFDAAWTLTGSSDVAVAGESFTLTCNPQDSSAGVIFWKRLDLDTTSTGTNRASIEANGCSIGQGSDTQYQYTCEPGPIYKLTIPANVMTNSQNNKIWRCESFFGGAEADYTVTVTVPVSNISLQEILSGNQQVNVIPVYENIQKIIYCITTGCRPRANVTVTTTGVTKGQFTEEFLPQNGDLTITRVSQVITTTKGGSTTKTIQCSAVNIQGRPPIISQLATIVVYYLPSEEPTLTGYTTGTILYVGDNDITLTCQQSGGYPLSEITWACDGQTGTTNNSQTVASSYVQLTVNRNLNGRMCTCTVRHPDNNLAYTRMSSVTFTVYYPPTTPTLQTSGARFPWVENTPGVLKCVTTPGFPTATTYEWVQNGQVVNGQTSETFTIPTLSNIHNGIQIQCRVSNGYTTQRPPTAIISNTLILDVQYTPIITLDTTSISTQEGSSRSRPCSAIGNPTPTVKWYRGNSVQTSGTGTSATLMFSNIDRNQSDTYICRATSTGTRNFVSSKSLSVIVYYPPVVTVTIQNTTENATNAVLTCNADGFPTNYTYHGWTQYIGGILVRSDTDFSGILSDSNRKIILPRVKFEDTGRYYCIAENGIQGRQPAVRQQGSSYFDVKASAKFDPNEEARKPGELHKNFTISIRFYSNPPAIDSNVKWINKTSRNPLTNSGITSLGLINTQIQRSIYGKTVTLPGQSAMLNIAPFQSFHIGHYALEINNGGSLTSSFDFEIITSVPPEQPSEFTIVQNKTNSVILTWNKGFNGGHPQTFIIRYKDTVSGKTLETEIEDTNHNSNYTIEIDQLNPSTIYHFWIYSTNEKGNSTLSGSPVIGKTLKEADSGNQGGNVGAIAGGVSGVLIAVIVIVVIVVIIIYRRRAHPGTKKSGNRQNGRFPLTARGDQSDEEDGVRDNILYEPAGPNFVKPGSAAAAAKASTSGGATGGQNDYPYAEVQKNKNGKMGIDNPAPVYAEVQKNTKKDKKPDPSAVYAEVQKPKKQDKGKEGKGGAKPKNLLGKQKEKKPKPGKKVAEEGSLYENMDELNATNKDDGKKAPKAPKNKNKPKKNKDGLIYADIVHESKPNGESKLVIRGLENKTDYAEVDFNRSGKPLPPDNAQADKPAPPNTEM